LRLTTFFALISMATGMVSLDNAAAHIAAATGVPVAALFGPGSAPLSRPYAAKARAVYLEDVPCRLCNPRCTQPWNLYAGFARGFGRPGPESATHYLKVSPVDANAEIHPVPRSAPRQGAARALDRASRDTHDAIAAVRAHFAAA
jgi:hypothetical protein